MSLRVGERFVDKRGTLIAFDPGEIRHAMISAIARGVDAGVDTAVLDQWRLLVLSCTATFHIDATDENRLHSAMQLRENIRSVMRQLH